MQDLTPKVARRLIVGIAAVGVLLRLAFGLLYWTGQPMTRDEHEYLALARGITSGAGFVYPGDLDVGTGQQVGRAPGYPLFLAALDAGRPIPTNVPVRVKVAQSFVGAAIIWLIGLLALHSIGARAGVVAAGVAAVYPPLVFMSAYALSETVYCALALSTAMVLQKAVDRADWRLGGLAGLLAGAATLTRPAMLFFLALAGVWVLARRRHATAIALTIGTILVVAPWTLRNWRVYDRFVLIASEGGVTFWTGNHPLARGEGDLAANLALKQADLAFRAAHPGLSPEDLEPLYYRDALRWIAENPAAWIALVLRKAFYTIVPTGPSYALHSVRYRVASAVPYLIVLPFAIVGIRRLWRSPLRPSALLLLAASSVLMCLIFFPQERFRLPILDPVLIVSAAALTSRPQS